MREDVKAISMVWLSKTNLTNLNSGEGGSNLVDIKKYRWKGRDYPYVSGQAMRFYLKEAIRREVNPEEACIADERGETCGQIEKCVLCDLFGFMTTLPDKGALVRLSPVKMSPAIGLIPLDETMVTDFLTRRHRGAAQAQAGELRGDIVNVELAINIYKAGLCLDLLRVGSDERPKEIGRIEGARKKRRGSEEVEAKILQSVELVRLVDESERARRVKLLLDAVKDFSDYSKQARLLTDFTPDFILIALQRNYSHRLQKAIELRDDGSITLHTERLDQILREVEGECVRVDGKAAVYAGMIRGLLENEDEVEEILKSRGIEIVSPREAIERAEKSLGLL